MNMSKIGMFRVLIHLMRDTEPRGEGKPDRDTSSIEMIDWTVFPTDFIYQSHYNTEFFSEYISAATYDDFEFALKDLPDGIYEIVGDFMYWSGYSWEGEFDDMWDPENIQIRALSPEDIVDHCPEEFHDDNARAIKAEQDRKRTFV